MERFLDRLFAACGALAALFLFAIFALVLAQIGGRLAGRAVPGADEFAGYCLSASTFLALGYALRRDRHIRVTLLLDRLPPGARRRAETFCTLFGLAFALAFAGYTAEMLYWSVVFNDVTQGLVPLPLWLPQSGMLLGAAALALAFAADALRLAQGRSPVHLLAARAEAEAREGALARD